jgi:hypothetical protein
VQTDPERKFRWFETAVSTSAIAAGGCRAELVR